jgi:hypothetical protein
MDVARGMVAKADVLTVKQYRERAGLFGVCRSTSRSFGAQEYELLAERIEGLWFRAELAPALAFGPGKS